MANIMDMKSIRNNAHRSGFDNSRRVCFTAKVGEILPVHWMPVLPGDDIDINLSSFGRTAPLQTASMARIREYYDVYFVPYRLLWDKFPDWIVQTDAPTMAKSLTTSVSAFPTMPYFTSEDLANVLISIGSMTNPTDEAGQPLGTSTSRLLSYLGYMGSVNVGTNRALNPFPLLAYQKIYQDYFRSTQWEDTAPWTCNLDYITSSQQLHLNIDSLTANSGAALLQKNLFNLQYCNYDKDYFLGMMPTAQFGDESMVSVIGKFNDGAFINADMSGDLSLSLSAATGSDRIFVTTSNGAGNHGELAYNGSGSVTIKSHVPYTAENTKFVIDNKTGVISANPITSQFGILALRRAECLQKWKEITLSGDTDYVSQLQKHWNVSAPASMSNRCQYLGGTANNLDISEVINTNLQDGGIADFAGKGITTNGGHVKFKNPNNEYGILMVLYHTKPIVEWKYSQILDRALLDTHQTDFPIPEFDSIGMEQVFKYEFIPRDDTQAGDSNEVAGYVPRYASYKTSFDICMGEFEDTLRSWILPFSPTFEGDVNQVITYLMFKVRPDIADNLWAVNAKLADHFYNSLYLDIKSVRNLSRDGLPY